MNHLLALVAATVVGIDVGWQPLPDGGFEYIIQIEPHTLDSLKAGQDIASQLPPALQGVRSYRITVGDAELPHVGEPPPVQAETPTSSLAQKPARPKSGDSPSRKTYSQTTPPAADSGTPKRSSNLILPGPDLSEPASDTGEVKLAAGNATPTDVAAEGPTLATEKPKLDGGKSSGELQQRTAGYMQYPQTVPPPATALPPRGPQNPNYPGTPPSIRGPGSIAPGTAGPGNGAVGNSAVGNTAVGNTAPSPAVDMSTLPPPPNTGVFSDPPPPSNLPATMDAKANELMDRAGQTVDRAGQAVNQALDRAGQTFGVPPAGGTAPPPQPEATRFDLPPATAPAPTSVRGPAIGGGSIPRESTAPRETSAPQGTSDFQGSNTRQENSPPQGDSAPRGSGTRGSRETKGTETAGTTTRGTGGKATDVKDTDAKGDSDATAATVAKPWLPLMGTVLALFASLGTNLYLGMNTLSLRSRYQELIRQHRAA